jgi:hypothetical protein
LKTSTWPRKISYHPLGPLLRPSSPCCRVPASTARPKIDTMGGRHERGLRSCMREGMDGRDGAHSTLPPPTIQHKHNPSAHTPINRPHEQWQYGGARSSLRRRLMARCWCRPRIKAVEPQSVLSSPAPTRRAPESLSPDDGGSLYDEPCNIMMGRRSAKTCAWLWSPARKRCATLPRSHIHPHIDSHTQTPTTCTRTYTDMNKHALEIR